MRTVNKDIILESVPDLLKFGTVHLPKVCTSVVQGQYLTAEFRFKVNGILYPKMQVGTALAMVKKGDVVELLSKPKTVTTKVVKKETESVTEEKEAVKTVAQKTLDKIKKRKEEEAKAKK